MIQAWKGRISEVPGTLVGLPIILPGLQMPQIPQVAMTHLNLISGLKCKYCEEFGDIYILMAFECIRVWIPSPKKIKLEKLQGKNNNKEWVDLGLSKINYCCFIGCIKLSYKILVIIQVWQIQKLWPYHNISCKWSMNFYLQRPLREEFYACSLGTFCNSE